MGCGAIGGKGKGQEWMWVRPLYKPDDFASLFPFDYSALKKYEYREIRLICYPGYLALRDD